MTDIKHSSHRVENSFDSNYVGIFDQSESMLDATTSKGIVREDTQYDGSLFFLCRISKFEHFFPFFFQIHIRVNWLISTKNETHLVWVATI